VAVAQSAARRDEASARLSGGLPPSPSGWPMRRAYCFCAAKLGWTGIFAAPGPHP
jgi:hypothetical protein